MSTTIKPHDLRCNLAQYMGSDTFTRWSILYRNDVLTEGTSYLARHAECFWLMDAIAAHQTDPSVRREEFQVWFLRQRPLGDWHLYCEDGNNNLVTEQVFETSDFPLPEGITLWACRNDFGGITIMLPTEY